MLFRPALIPVRLVRRYQRFLADVRFEDGSVHVAHLKNTGRMTGCDRPESPALVSPVAPGGGRKLLWNLRLVKPSRAWVCVDTSIANEVVFEALQRRSIPELGEYTSVRREVRFGQASASRADMFLEQPMGSAPGCFVEVKNVTLREGRGALFPDAVSRRALRHLIELESQVRAGRRAVLIPLVARADCDWFGAAAHIDPDWARALERAQTTGVEILPYRARVDRRGVRLGQRLPWRSAGGVR